MKYQNFKNKLKSFLDPSKKTVVFFSQLGNYIKLFGNLHNKFKKNNWNVINLKTYLVDSKEFEKKAPTFIVPNFTQNGFEDNLDLDFIDLIISVNSTDKNFISFTVQGLYLPHDPLCGILPAKATKYVFLATEQAIKNMQSDNCSYETKNRCLISGGYPRLDSAIKYYKKNKNKKEENSILYMPTSGEPINATFNQLQYIVGFDYHLIQILLMNFDYDIIVNNHPADKIVNKLYLQFLAKKFKDNPRVHINKIDMHKAYVKSKFLITDVSDTAFTYSFTTLKPSIFYVPYKKIKSKNQPTNIVGVEIRSLDKMCKNINKILKNSKKFKKQIKRYRDKTYLNLLNSEQYLIDNIDYILENKKHPNWIYT